MQTIQVKYVLNYKILYSRSLACKTPNEKQKFVVLKLYQQLTFPIKRNFMHKF